MGDKIKILEVDMKKLILIIMVILGTITFSEKLNTDGKLNADKMVGSWANEDVLIIKKSNNYYLRYFTNEKPDGYSKPFLFKQINAYTLKAVDDDGTEFCYAYDTKKKNLASLKCGTNNVEDFLPKKYNTFGG